MKKLAAVFLAISSLMNFTPEIAAQNIASFSRHDIPVTFKSELLLVKDLNNDSVLDLVSVNGNGKISVFLGNGDGTFQNDIITSADVTIKYIAAADFNGDGRMDLAINNKILLGNNAGSFIAVNGIPDFMLDERSAVAGDINNDDIPDLMIGMDVVVDDQILDSGMLILLGKGDATFKSGTNISSNGKLFIKPWYIEDFDDDGNMDIFATYAMSDGDGSYSNFTFYASYFPGDGEGAFGSPIDITSWRSNFTDSPVVKDFNLDGILDVFSSFRDENHYSLSLGEEGGYFQPTWNSSTVYFSNEKTNIPFVIDINNDSFLDLGMMTLEGNPDLTNHLAFNLGKGDGTFGDTITDDKDAVTGQIILVADANNDKKDDFFIAQQDSYFISIFTNQGIQAGIRSQAIQPLSFNTVTNLPNPFNGYTVIKYTIDKNERIELSVYDISGRKIKTLHDGFHKTGSYSVRWDGKDNFGKNVSSGIYICLLKNKGEIIASNKMLFMK